MNSKIIPLEVAGVSQETPHSLEAEQALLGALMLNNELMDDVELVLRPEYFYVPFHEQIFETIQGLIAKGWAASPLTLRDSLRERQTFDKDGDLIEHLTTLAENASLATDVPALASIIHNHFRNRQLQAVGMELTRGVGKVTPEETDQVIVDTEAALFALGEGGGRPEALGWKAALLGAVDDIYGAHERGSGLVGVTSGLPALDELTGGLEASDLIILAGRPSMGKTALAMNLAVSAARAVGGPDGIGAKVGIFSLEMSASQLTLRVLAGAAGVDSVRMKRGRLSDGELDQVTGAVQEISNLGLVIDDQAALEIDDLRSRARRLVRKHGVGMIVVDYIQLLHARRGRADSGRVQEMSEITQGLKAMAKELSIPVIGLSQLSRAVESRENKRPLLSDLRESGSIEQDADIVMFLYREEYYRERVFGPEAGWTPDQRAIMLKLKGHSELILAKQRRGPTGALGLMFDAPTTSFRMAP